MYCSTGHISLRNFYIGNDFDFILCKNYKQLILRKLMHKSFNSKRTSNTSKVDYRREKSPRMNKRTVLFIWKSGDRSEDKSRTSDFRIETSPMSPVTIKTLVAVKKKDEFQLQNCFTKKSRYILC